MKKAARKIILSVFALAISLSLAITSTFAWFTMTSTPIVDELTINVTTSEGLEISLPGGNFKPRISSDEIMGYLFGTGENYDYDGKYSPVDFKLIASTTEDGKVYKDLEGGTINDGDYAYLELVINFRSNYKQEVYLNPNPDRTYVDSEKPEGSTATPAYAWAGGIGTGYGFEYADGELGSSLPGFDEGDVITGVKAANAVRIAFDNSVDNPVIWYPNPDKGYNWCTNFLKVEDFVAKNLAKDYYENSTGKTITIPSYYNHNVTEGEEEEEVTYAGISNYSMNYYNADADNFIITDKLLTLEEDGDKFVGSLTIRIWIEGFDGDCFDAVFEDIIKVGLQFKGVMVEE